MKVLLVDDDKTTLALLEQFLDELGHKVFTASDGTKAIELLDRKEFDLVLSDVVMPLMGGFDLLSYQKRCYPHDDTKVVLYSAIADEEQRKRALQMGAYHYWVKPFKLEWLVRLIDEIAGQSREREDA